MAPVYRHMPLTGVERTRRYNSKLVTKTCLECGITFEGQHSRKAICSDACRKARRRRAYPPTFNVCAHCGHPFGPVSHLSRRYCSHACASAHRRGRPSHKRGKNYPHLRRAPERACLACGTTFRAVKDFAGRSQLYCSHRCYLLNRRVSHFEERVGQLLECSGLVLDRQKRIKRWVVDYAVPGTTLLVEADGSYWHGSQQVVERDKRKTQELTAMGYEMYRIDERAFMADPRSACAAVVQRFQKLTGIVPIVAATGEKRDYLSEEST